MKQYGIREFYNIINKHCTLNTYYICNCAKYIPYFFSFNSRN